MPGSANQSTLWVVVLTRTGTYTSAELEAHTAFML
jgi:hypothetical protein